MCGIAGLLAPGRQPNKEAVRQMLSSMAHRGPDDVGLEVLAGGHLIFGHLRLSIIDLSPLGHQPMATPGREAWLVYNGEIYNFREIRATLRSVGWQFRSDSDTEVILAAYRQWGLDAVSRFRGMFAFALWDANSNQLHLCRDRFGVKPLYYSNIGGVLAFASELKALNCNGFTSKSIDPFSLSEYVQYGYVSAPGSIFSDVRSVPPGCFLSFDASLNCTKVQYWSNSTLFEGSEAVALRRQMTSMADEEVIELISSSLEKAFAYRLVSDVPVGLFLSGGIDSSLVAAMLAKQTNGRLNTFTIGYGSAEFDETRYAQAVAGALGSNHFELKISDREALDAALHIAHIADEPIGDSSLVPTFLVARYARTHVKVALSADGADELFGGYPRYRYCGRFAQPRSTLLRSLYYISGAMLEQLPPKLVAFAYSLTRAGGPKYAALSDKLRKFIRMTKARDVIETYDAAISEWPADKSRDLVKSSMKIDDEPMRAPAQGAADPYDYFMQHDLSHYLPGDLLTKVDRATMAVSLEAREPFLDHEMARLAAALPLRWKLNRTEGKIILRRLLARHFPSTLFDRPKMGFSAPVRDWLRGPMRDVLLQQLSEERIRHFGLLDVQNVQAAVSDFLSGDGRGTSAAGIWILLQLQQWADRWLLSPRTADLSTR